MIVHAVLSLSGWLLAAMGFESGYERLRGAALTRLPKSDLSLVFWSSLAVLAFACGSITSLLHVLCVAPVAAVHVDLCRRSRDRITLDRMLHHGRSVVASFIRRSLTKLRRVPRWGKW